MSIKKAEAEDRMAMYERKIFDLRQLIEISKGLNSTLEYNILIDSILLTCMGQMQLIKAGIFLKRGIDDESFVLHRNYKGFELNHNIEYVIPPHSRLVALLDGSFHCLTMKEIKSLLPKDTKALKTLTDIEPTLIVPLKGKGRLNGIIVLGERINKLPFEESEKGYLLDMASIAGIAIENAYLYELATTDMMTKLKMHHFFQTSLMEERDKATKKKQDLAMIMLDIDNFKSFNDTYGHLCGDVVLKRVAKIIKDNCRHNDIAARYGGEEMALLLPKTDIEAAKNAAERIRANIESEKVNFDGVDVSVTVSVGVSEFICDKDKSNNDFINRTDKALYVAKRNGKNQVVVIPADEAYKYE